MRDIVVGLRGGSRRDFDKLPTRAIEHFDMLIPVVDEYTGTILYYSSVHVRKPRGVEFDRLDLLEIQFAAQQPERRR